MKQSTKDLLVNLINIFAGKALTVFVLGILTLISIDAALPQSSGGNGDIETPVRGLSPSCVILLLGIGVLVTILVLGICNMKYKRICRSEEIAAEIAKLKLDICKIKCERELVELKDRCLKSQKAKSAPDN